MAGCEAESEKAEREYDVVSKSASSVNHDDKCAAAKKVKQAYLKERNQERYELWSLLEYSACLP